VSGTSSKNFSKSFKAAPVWPWIKCCHMVWTVSDSWYADSRQTPEDLRSKLTWLKNEQECLIWNW
jgi:hypothetical protein